MGDCLFLGLPCFTTFFHWLTSRSPKQRRSGKALRLTQPLRIAGSVASQHDSTDWTWNGSGIGTYPLPLLTWNTRPRFTTMKSHRTMTNRVLSMRGMRLVTKYRMYWGMLTLQSEISGLRKPRYLGLIFSFSQSALETQCEYMGLSENGVYGILQICYFKWSQGWYPLGFAWVYHIFRHTTPMRFQLQQLDLKLRCKMFVNFAPNNHPPQTWVGYDSIAIGIHHFWANQPC